MSAFAQGRMFPSGRLRQVLAVHDEIQASRGVNAHPYLVHGLLLVPQNRRAWLVGELRRLRRGYAGPMHYTEIKKPAGPRSETAFRWIDWFKKTGLQVCKFKVFAVEQDAFQKFPYRGDQGYGEHILRNTSATVIAGLRWSFPGDAPVLVELICDETGDSEFRRSLQRLPTFIARSMRERRREQRARASRSGGTPRLAPLVRIQRPVSLRPSDPRRATPGREDDTELIQLTDVLLGCIWDAVSRRIDGSRNAHGRLQLSESIGSLRTAHPVIPWAAKLHDKRALSVSIYPDEYNRAYPAPKTIRPTGQLRLPIYDSTFAPRKARIKSNSLKPEGEPWATECDALWPDGPAGLAPVDGSRASHPTYTPTR